MTKPIVDVVIPVYNYGEAVKRAINSVRAQTVTNFACYIVNDGSTDDTEKAVKDAIKDDPRFHYIYQGNAGVANARNKGVFSGEGKYVCCLDADDALAPEFLKACVLSLEDDPTIDIAYTGLYYIKPGGEEGISPWPEDSDYDKQLQGKNQIPTCCVMRRKVWERLGGQRQRYAPEGAGEEDAEMWLRAGAYGFRAKKVTNAGLFIYSWMSGRVSGSKDHKMTDYRSWHPWTQDGQHPLASMATPQRMSHPARQYDEPLVSVIIPVGNGHENDIIDALDSLESQTFRKWEVIIAWDSDEEVPERIKKAYPYIRLISRKSGASGPGAARNAGVRIARAPFILFLDADDWLTPPAIEMMVAEWETNKGIIYSDYFGRAFISKEEAVKLSKADRLLFYDEKRGRAIIGHQSAEFHCLRAINQPDQDMYIWCLVTCLIPKTWHEEIGGFDEDMSSWEDWDYFIRMAKAGYCFYRIPEKLVTYRFYTGSRREEGREDFENLIQYMRTKYKGIRNMPCNCGDKKTRPSANPQQMESEMLNDTNFVMIEYLHPNRGQHRVVGGVTGTDYAYRAGGDTFLVNKKDVEVQPHLFKVIDTPQVQSAVIAPPTPVVEDAPPPPMTFDPQLIAGVTPDMAKQLTALGVTGPGDILELGKDGLADSPQVWLSENVDGVGPARADAIVEYAKSMLDD